MVVAFWWLLEIFFQEEIRISHKEIDPEKAFLGPLDRWHHVGCFIKSRHELEWNDEYTAEMLTNFKSLDANDRETIKKLLTKKYICLHTLYSSHKHFTMLSFHG